MRGPEVPGLPGSEKEFKQSNVCLWVALKCPSSAGLTPFVKHFLRSIHSSNLSNPRLSPALFRLKPLLWLLADTGRRQRWCSPGNGRNARKGLGSLNLCTQMFCLPFCLFNEMPCRAYPEVRLIWTPPRGPGPPGRGGGQLWGTSTPHERSGSQKDQLLSGSFEF